LHEQGRAAEAERLYQAILRADGDHADCLHYLGLLRAQQGRLEEAVGLLRRAVARDPTSPEAQNHLGSVLHAMKRYPEALVCFERACALDHDYAEAHYNGGVALQALGRHQAAVGYYEEALRLEPNAAAAHYNLGLALQSLNRREDAGAHFAKALAAKPDYIQPLIALGELRQAQGRSGEAIEHYARAIAIAPSLAVAHDRMGIALQSLGCNGEAVAAYEKASALEPGSATIHDRLGGALQALGRFEEAAMQHKKALGINPSDADAHNNLGLALQALKRFTEAMKHHQKALAIRPGFAAANNNLGRALQALNRHDEAIAQYQVAIANGPQNASRYANLGMALQEMGDLDAAARAYEKAIERAPNVGRFYRNLADCRQFVSGDPHLAAMEKLARDRASLPEEGQRQLLFALAKACADTGQYERSFGYLLEGNALKRRQIGYDEAKVLGTFARTSEVFNAEAMVARRGCGEPSSVPVFIIGMPRSGTTLVEQMLASHSRVFGAGELADFGEAVSHVVGSKDAYPGIVPSLSTEQLQQIGARYVAGVVATAPQAARITDKMPLNFEFAGLIHLALPNAHIIHTRRDPVDTCFSCFSTLFTGHHRVAYELAELGRYYRAYERLMDHWRKVIPADAMLDVQYEDLVADFETHARRIVAFCGLEWEAQCLDFHKTKRPVRTASAAQVRRPIYQSSIGRWQPYKHLLQPLLDELSA